MNTLGGQLAVSGFYETTNLAKPTFDVGLKMIKVNIPAAFEAFTTVQMLAPVAKYATGLVTTDVNLSGGLGKNMMPIFSALTGRGNFQTSNVALRNFPGMEKIVDVTKLQILNNPTMQAFKGFFQIKEGRLVLQPFDVKVAGLTMNVAGSNGIDQSLEYDLGLKVPKSLLGGGANQAIARSGVEDGCGPSRGVGDPARHSARRHRHRSGGQGRRGQLSPPSVTKGAEQAVKQAVTQKVDSAALRVVAEAERQAAAIRQQAESLAAKIKLAGYEQADALTAKAGDDPLAAAGAKLAADQLRQQTDQQAQGIIGEASRRADSLIAAARRQAER